MLKKHLKKIYYKFFTKRLSDEEVFQKKLLQNKLIDKINKEKDFYIVENASISLIIRNKHHSDYDVFKQIFNSQEYKIVLSVLKHNFSKKHQFIFIDAGANVGYTSLYFLKTIPNIKIFAIEPSVNNMNVCKKNISLNKYNDKIIFYQNALTGVKNKKFSIDNTFRDGKDWSLSTKEKSNGEIKGITLNEIMDTHKLDYITFLKIDIEGAEMAIFKEENDLSFLNKTKCIAIEIHDEFNIKELICDILKQHKFILFESGELTIGLNKSYI